MEREDRIRNVCYILVTIIASGFLIYLVCRHLLPALLPFFFAWALAISLKGPIEFVRSRAKIPRRAAAVSVVLVFFFGVGYLLFLFFSSFASQLHGIYERISESSTGIELALGRAARELSGVLSRIPVIGKTELFSSFSQDVEDKLLSALPFVAERVLPHIASFIGKVASSIPYIALFLLVSAISVFYFCCELPKINYTLASFFPPRAREFLFLVKREIFSVVFGYIRAYSVIMLITFFEVFAGLSVIGVEYALVLSVFIAVVDILPVLGAGIVLVPWGALLVFFGSTAKGVSILVLYLLITVLRQFLEPRIVGNAMGLHPLLMLLALYVGARLFGFLGIVFLPIILIVTRNVYESIRSGEGQVPGVSDTYPKE